MEKIEILLIMTVAEAADLTRFSLEDLSDFWSSLSICCSDEYFFDSFFDEKEQERIKNSLERVEAELKRRHKEPVNFFQLIQTNPDRVEYYLKHFDNARLLELETDLQEYQNSKLVAALLKLVRKQIYRRIAVC